MLGKAAKENVVVNVTNLYDQFFVSALECNAKITAARLPYFDEDYFPGAAEDLIYQKKRRSGQSDLPLDPDDLLMQNVNLNLHCYTKSIYTFLKRQYIS